MRLLLAGTAAIGAGFIGLSLVVSLPLDLVLMFIVGFGVIAMAATTNTTIQLSTPDALRGRVMSVYTTVFAGSVPFGGLFSGLLAAAAGVQVALAVGGAIALLAVAGAALWLRRPVPIEATA
jgi:MFS family permease